MLGANKNEVLSAFSLCVSHYQELVSVGGGIGATDYSKGSNQGGKVTHTGSTLIIKPSKSDFICDVEKAAIRCLNTEEKQYWLRYYKPRNARNCATDSKVHKCVVDGEDYWYKVVALPEHEFVPQVVVLTKEEIEETGFDLCLNQHLDRQPQEQRAAIAELDLSMRQKLGMEFIDSGLAPPKNYLESSDLRNVVSKKPKKGHWSHLYGN